MGFETRTPEFESKLDALFWLEVARVGKSTDSGSEFENRFHNNELWDLQQIP